MKKILRSVCLFCFALILLSPARSVAWNDETHLAVSKAAGFKKLYNSAGADITKIKAGKIEGNNHYHNNHRGTIMTTETVLSQVGRYNTLDADGHLYGAIVASIRRYKEEIERGKYGGYHLAFCAHYVGDLSQPLHNTRYNAFNQKNHRAMDRIVEDEALDNLDKIILYPITITSEMDLAGEIARIANLSMSLGYKMEDEARMLTKTEAYRMLSHSASLLKAILNYLGHWSSRNAN